MITSALLTELCTKMKPNRSKEPRNELYFLFPSLYFPFHSPLKLRLAGAVAIAYLHVAAFQPFTKYSTAATDLGSKFPSFLKILEKATILIVVTNVDIKNPFKFYLFLPFFTHITLLFHH